MNVPAPDPTQVQRLLLRSRTGDLLPLVLVEFMIEVHHRRMPFTQQTADDHLDGHTGYVAGRYRDGAYSDIWTDVRRCAFRTFTAYAPACSCGWRGPGQPVTDIAYIACRRAWARDHAVPQDVDLPTTVHDGVPCVQLRSDRAAVR